LVGGGGKGVGCGRCISFLEKREKRRPQDKHLKKGKRVKKKKEKQRAYDDSKIRLLRHRHYKRNLKITVARELVGVGGQGTVRKTAAAQDEEKRTQRGGQ